MGVREGVTLELGWRGKGILEVKTAKMALFLGTMSTESGAKEKNSNRKRSRKKKGMRDDFEGFVYHVKN